MPLLIQAVPLAKNWLGGRYWRTPAFDTLPEELEYLPREEIAKRFEKLNRIALRTYPTVWPTIIFLLVFLGLASIAGYALSKIGSSNLAIMGQGICFLLPIVIVVWVKVRKESKARARRRFKHQSQKVLRTWTAQDTITHAMQWKIRLRPKSVASPWLAQTRLIRRRRSSSQPSPQQQPQRQRRHQRQEQELDQLQDHGQPLSPNEQQQEQHQQHFHAGTTVISMTDALRLDHHQTPDDHEGSDIATLHRVSWVDPRHRREHPTQGPLEGDQNQRPPSFIHHTPEESSSTVAPLSPIVSLYETFRARTQRGRTTSVDSTNTTHFVTLSQQQQQQQQQQQDTGISPLTATPPTTNTPNISHVSTSLPSATRGEFSTTTFTAGASIWNIFRECLSNSICFGFLFVEPKVWLIEISLRECQLDEYALTVPSPVYCDYRLPGYDDVIAGAAGSAEGSSGVVVAASSSRTGLHRYNGLPPAYESESESEGEDDDDLDDDLDGDEDDDDLGSGGIDVQIQSSIGCRLTQPTPAHLPDIGTSSNSAGTSTPATHSVQPQMEMIQRPFEMTSIMVLATPQLSATTSGTPLPPPTRPSSSSQEYTPDDPATRPGRPTLPSIVEFPADMSK